LKDGSQFDLSHYMELTEDGKQLAWRIREIERNEPDGDKH
jgi:hypothetical protein